MTTRHTLGPHNGRLFGYKSSRSLFLLLGIMIMSGIVPATAQKIAEEFEQDSRKSFHGETDYRYTVSGKTSVTVQIDAVKGNVSITGTATNDVKINEEIMITVPDRHQARDVFDTHRGVVTYHQKENRILIQGNGEWHPAIHVEYDLEIPGNSNIIVHTIGGEVEVNSIRGPVEVRTGGGDMEIQDIQGAVTAITGGGDIDASHVVGDVTLTTSGGEIAAENITGNCVVESSGGDINIEYVEGNVSATTSGGNIELAEISGTTVNAFTSGGNIDVQTVIGKVEMHTNGGHLTAEEIQGDLTGTTKGGSINLDRISGQTTVDTKGGSISGDEIRGGITALTTGGEIYIVKSMDNSIPEQSINLDTEYGDIRLVIPSNFPAEFDAIVLGTPFPGAIDSEIPLVIQRSQTEVRGTGTIETGNIPVILKVKHGQIIIERR